MRAAETRAPSPDPGSRGGIDAARARQAAESNTGAAAGASDDDAAAAHDKRARDERSQDKRARGGDASTNAQAKISADAPPAPPVPSARPPARVLRFVKAYWVTFVVIGSYLSVRFQSRFRSPDAIARLLGRKHIQNARRIERAIVSLQGLFIKVGQLISIMTNFLPEEFRKQLEGLQDHVPAHPYPEIERRIREELGRGPDELFATFERVPIASASIGQVHIATLRSGAKVAVKVQYPDIERIVRTDLRTLRRIFRIVAVFSNTDGLDDVYREISAMILDELDFRREAANIGRVAQHFADRLDVGFPEPVAELSTGRVLTTRFERGFKINDTARLAEHGLCRRKLARKVVELYCQQIFTDGVYHADPHPGNLLVRPCDEAPDGVCVVFLDFGAVAEISPQMRAGIVDVILGALSRDTERIVRAMKQMGFIARDADNRVFEKIVEYFHERFQEEISLDSFNLRDIRFDPQKGLDNLADLRRMDISLRELTESFHVPKEWILLERTLLLLVGLCTELDPEMNPMSVIRPYLERFVLGDEGDWSSLVVNTTKDLVMTATALPAELRKVLRQAQTGELSMRFHGLGRSTQLVYRLGHQAIYAAIGIAGAVIAIILEGRGELARAEYAWWTARVAGGLLVWSWLTTRTLLRNRQ